LAIKITAGLGAGASPAASSSATGLLKTALRGLFWDKGRGGTGVGAGIICALLLLSTVFRTQKATDPPPAALVAPSVSPRPSATNDSGPNPTSAGRKLALLVARTEDRQPVRGARVLVDCYVGREKRRIFDAMTDSQGGLDIPIPTRAFS